MGGHFVVVEHRNLDVFFFALPFRPAQEFVDFHCRLLAVGHRIDDQSRSKGDVARGKDSWRRRHQRVWIEFECALTRRFDTVFRFQEGKVRSLANRQNHRVARDNEFRSRFEFRVEALVFIKNRNAFDNFQAG